ncbi:MAG: DUF5591 domain-containing protein [Methanosphaera sp.]|nr:DUF5591 domain-containing protein [Methanosphaera sp.]
MNTAKIPCISELSLNRPEVIRWQERMKLLEPYSDTIVILPCSMKKPYSQSKSHMLYKKYTKGLQEVILTSPFGICPREMENTYPIQSYDASTTGDWSAEEIEASAKVLKDYAKDYNIIAHVTGGYKLACEESGLDITYTCNDGSTRSKESLDNLKMEVKKADKVSNSKHRLHDLRSIARYQFNSKKMDALISDNTQTRGRFNKRILDGKKQIATLHFETGLYTLNLDAGEILKEQKINRVFINFDLSSNTVFTPGIEGADDGIIPNDEVVVVCDDQVMGVGKSMLSSDELVNSSKGVGIKLRHRVK